MLNNLEEEKTPFSRDVFKNKYRLLLLPSSSIWRVVWRVELFQGDLFNFRHLPFVGTRTAEIAWCESDFGTLLLSSSIWKLKKVAKQTCVIFGTKIALIVPYCQRQAIWRVGLHLHWSSKQVLNQSQSQNHPTQTSPIEVMKRLKS